MGQVWGLTICRHFGAGITKVEPPCSGDSFCMWHELDVNGTSPGQCEELTTSSFRGQAREARGNEGRNRQGRRGGARRIYPQEYRRRRGRGCRSECRVDLHLKGMTKEMDEVRSEDEGDDYQGGIDDDEDGKSNRIQVGSWLGRMHKWAV